MIGLIEEKIPLAEWTRVARLREQEMCGRQKEIGGVVTLEGQIGFPPRDSRVNSPSGFLTALRTNPPGNNPSNPTRLNNTSPLVSKCGEVHREEKTDVPRDAG